MSSKILHGDRGEPAEPIVWRLVAPAPGGSRHAHLPGDRGVESLWRDPLESFSTRLPDREADVEQRVEQARQSGFQEGEAVGLARAEARLEPLMERLAGTLAELSACRPRLRQDAEQDLVKLAMAIARRILHRELAIDPEALLGLVKAALEKLEAQECGRVRVFPEGASAIEKYLERAGLREKIQVIPDPALDQGGAVFETSRGSLDVSVETQLQEIQRGLADRLHLKP